MSIASLSRAALRTTVTFVTLCPWPAFAAQELVTDRPDQTESAVVVPRGSVQLETGWSHADRKFEGVRTTTDGFPQTLLRIGWTPRVEVRVGFSGYVWQDVDGASGKGFGDNALGAKIGLLDEQGARPQTALLVGVTLPTGDEDFSSERYDPSFRLAMSNTLTERLSIGYNVGASWSSDLDDGGERDTLSVLNWTAALGIGATERLAFFVELFGEAGLSAGGAPANSLDGGVTYLLTDTLQLDASAGAGLSETADDWFVGAGLSARFD